MCNTYRHTKVFDELTLTEKDTTEYKANIARYKIRNNVDRPSLRAP